MSAPRSSRFGGSRLSSMRDYAADQSMARWRRLTLTLGEAAHLCGKPCQGGSAQVDLMSIGQFARRSRLSPKALRLYGELGLLDPARVDDESGYRYYSASQLDPRPADSGPAAAADPARRDQVDRLARAGRVGRQQAGETLYCLGSLGSAAACLGGGLERGRLRIDPG